jgi:hypothetical protein
MCVSAHCLNRQTAHARGNSPREIFADSQATLRRQQERREAKSPRADDFS